MEKALVDLSLFLTDWLSGRAAEDNLSGVAAKDPEALGNGWAWTPK
jgi:hypothetical protein